MTSRAILLLAFTLLGLAAASAATWVHAELVRHPDLSSVCDVSATVNCTQAYSSAYGKLAGVPVAVLGVVFFGALLALQAGARLLGVPDPAHVGAYVFVLSVPGVAFAAYLAVASWAVLHVVCLLCVTIDVATLGVCVIGALMTRFPFASLPARLGRDLKAVAARPAALVLAGAFATAALALVFGFPRAAAEPVFASGAVPEFTAPAPEAEPMPQQAQLDAYLDSAPRRMIPVDAPGAAVVIVKFNDYQCPPCGQTYAAYKPLKAKWDKQMPGKVKFVTKDFALDTECNGAIQQGLHPLACEAAAAVRMARKAGKAEALEDWLFANQPTLTLDGLRQAVKTIGGVSDYDAQYPKILPDVRTDTALGGFLGVRSTPTFFVNGIQMPTAQVEVMNAAIEHELRKAGVLK
jgi:protein-disulfide isomerase